MPAPIPFASKDKFNKSVVCDIYIS
jgi:hypothetical protein